MYALRTLVCTLLAMLVYTSVDAAEPVLVAHSDGLFVRVDSFAHDVTESADAVFARVGKLVHRFPTMPVTDTACTPFIRRFGGRAYLRRDAVECLGARIPQHEVPIIPARIEPLLDFAWPPATDSVRIVIDAGHGGHDSGAVGVDGLVEKEITLAISRMLHAHLNEVPGFDVYLTRTDDRYLSLRERSEIANRLQADLFISIHGNAGRRATAQGFEIFIAGRRADDADAMALASLENGGETDFVVSDTQNMLAELALADQRQQSARAADALLRRVTGKLAVENRGVKQAPFWVLLGSNMPAVLIETGFLSNHQESRLLADPAYQRQMTQALSDALEALRPSLLGRRMRQQHEPNHPRQRRTPTPQAHTELVAPR